MISLAHLLVIRAEAGMSVPRSDFNAIPHSQFDTWWSDLAELCPDRALPGLERRPANALNVEIGAPALRCKLQSPDGRGLAWIMSGGSVLAYGLCTHGACPRAHQRPEVRR